MFSLNPALKVIYGLSRNIDEEGKYLGYFPTLPPSTSIKKFKDGNFISQPSVFYRRSVFDRVGLLDESLKTAFDFDLFIRIFKVLKRSEIGFINKVLSYSRIHSNTITNKMRREVSLESMKVLYKHFKSAPTHWVITYINELFRDYPFIKNEVSLRQEISNFLIDSKIFFNEKDLIKLIGVLNIDARIKLSDTQYFINVFQDGWAGNELIVKMRYQKGQKSKLKLVCNGGWPSQRILKIKVYSSNGESEVYKVFSRGDFEILLEPTETQSKSFFFWKIKCNDCFIPSKSNVRSSDHRRLAFRVVSAFLE